MLRKLMRYDFGAVFGLWWIPAVTLTALAPLTGLFLYISGRTDDFSPMAVAVSAITGVLVFLYVVTFVATLLLSLFFCHRRFYCNFYTDEGYLTFTLPVSRRTLLLSKTLVTFIITLATLCMCAVSLLLLALTSGHAKRVFGAIGGWFERLSAQFGGFVPLYVAEAVLLILLFVVYLQLLIQFAITTGAMLAKKHKILVAIGIYYVASNVLELLLTLGAQFVVSFVAVAAVRFTALSAARIGGITALLLLMGALFVALLDVILYLVTLSAVERRLNLA